MKIRINGKKLKGEFALVRTRGRGENSWLMIKHRDKFATENDIRKKDKSVRSRKTIEGMTKYKKAKQWKSNRQAQERLHELEKRPQDKSTGRQAQDKTKAEEKHDGRSFERGKKKNKIKNS